jgi:hypothetical protein
MSQGTGTQTTAASSQTRSPSPSPRDPRRLAVAPLILARLILARLVVDRAKNAWALAVPWASGVFLQMSETIFGESHHDEFGFNGPFFVLRNYVTRVVVAAATKSCAAPGATAYTFVHEWWYVTIPCGKVG